jgi:hypothetical protein
MFTDWLVGKDNAFSLDGEIRGLGGETPGLRSEAIGSSSVPG